MTPATCRRGHEWSQFAYIDPRGKRQCRECRRLAALRFRAVSPRYLDLHKRQLQWPDRFWALVRKTNGCWLWQGRVNADGYGIYSGKSAHRLAFALLGGDIPDGTEIDHLCRTRNCVNPKHMEAVTHLENVRRADFSSRPETVLSLRQRAKTHCPQGHPYAGENLRVNASGGRVCRECERAKSRRYKQSKRGSVDTW